MNARARFALVAIAVISLILTAQNADAQVPIRGIVIDSRTQRPVPGLTVSLVHPRLGRSVPAFTDSYGQFFFRAIPIHPEPYYLEVYWGRDLIYRKTVAVQGPLDLGRIYL